MSTATLPQSETVARFKGTCAVCFKPIAKGESIRVYRKMNGKTRWAHANCYNAPADYPDDDGNGSEPQGVSAEVEAFMADIEARVKAIEAASIPLEIVVKHADGQVVHIEGLVHPKFDEILQLAQARKHIFLPGPAGCGKSHLAGQVAEALGLRFGFISCSAGMSESQLLGRMVPAGEGGKFVFLGTQFLDCYENGGVFLFDEIDAADANVLLVINSALANGHLSVPNRHENPVAKRHPDFVCIAAANTFGRGADRQYVGRSELDESTLDRFRIGTVPMDYDERLERQLCPDEKLFTRLNGYRERVRENRLERVVSTRFMKEAYKAVTELGWSYEKVDSKLMSGWRADEIAKVREGGVA
jgi:hypothetical protein